MTFPVGTFVEIVNPESKYYGKSGRVISNYRSGGENQAYSVRLWDGQEFWFPELDLIVTEAPRKQKSGVNN